MIVPILKTDLQKLTRCKRPHPGDLNSQSKQALGPNLFFHDGPRTPVQRHTITHKVI
jgi:hypothetical protein